MRESQYTDDYLRENARRGMGNGLTIGSYLASVLQGKAKKYAGQYVAALEMSVIRRNAIKGRSKQGGVAYYPRDAAQ